MIEDNKLFIYGLGRTDDLNIAKRQIEQFAAFHEKNGGIRLVSFHDTFPDDLDQNITFTKWRELFAYEELFSMWGNAYHQLDLILPTTPPRTRRLIKAYYHDAAYLMWQAIVLPVAVAKQTQPTCYLIPAALQDRFASAESGRGNTPPHRILVRVKRFAYNRVDEVQTYAKDIARSFRKDVADMWDSARKSWISVSLTRTMISGSIVAAILVPRYVSYCSIAGLRIAGRTLGIIQSFHLLRGMYRQRTKLKMVDTAFRSTLRRVKEKPRASPLGRRTLIVMTIDDGGSGVNLAPALKIAKEFQRKELVLVVVSSSDRVVDEFGRHGHIALPTQRSHIDFLRARGEYFLLCQEVTQIRESITGILSEYLCNWIGLFGFGMIASNQAVDRTLNAIDQVASVAGVLTVYESLPLSITAGDWAKRRQIPWIGFFPILVGDRPDGHHFPAPEHLVYGEQLRDMIIADGHPLESAIVVGSPTYDVFVGRDATADRRYCDVEFPGSRDRKLVVVATEAFADPLVEIGPVLAALSEMDGVFVIVKVHPSDSVTFFEQYVASLPRRGNIQVTGSCDLGALLHTADLLICIISNIIISAAVLGTPTLVCDFSNKRRVIDFVAAGLCRGCFVPSDIRTSVERLLFDPAEESQVREMLALGVSRFNGPSDGKSAQRIVDYTLARTDQGSRQLNVMVS